MANVEKVTKKEKIKLQYKLIAMLVLSLLLFAVFAGLSIYSICLDVINSKANYVMEEATLIKYEKMENDYTLTDEANYQLIYRYLSEDNREYQGVWQDYIANEDYAKSKVGATITIFVEHNLNKHSLEKPNYKTHIIFFSVPTIVFLVSSIDFIIKLVIYYKYAGSGIKENEVKEPKRILLPHIAIIAVFGTICMILAFNSGNTLNSYKTYINANFEEQEVSISYYKRVVQRSTINNSKHSTSSHQTYSTYFDYEIDGRLYTGCYQTGIDNENIAKEKLGQNITLYIDNDKGLITLDLDFHRILTGFWICLGFALVLGAIALNSFVRMALYFVEFKRMVVDIKRLTKEIQVVNEGNVYKGKANS